MTLQTPAWVDERDRYHPPQVYELFVIDVNVSH